MLAVLLGLRADRRRCAPLEWHFPLLLLAMLSPAESHDAVIAATRHWLTEAVIGLNLCPFAKAVHVKGQIRYAVSDAVDMEGVLADLETEIQALVAASPDAVDTTLLVIPGALSDFLDYNDCLFFAERMIKQLRLEGIIQIASFHPDRKSVV